MLSYDGDQLLVNQTERLRPALSPDDRDSVRARAMLADIAPIVVLILALALPVFIIIVSFRLNFILQASILLIVFLLGSVLAGASGLINIYRHVSNILQLDRVTALVTFLTQSQTFTRTLLSTVTSAIFIVKFFTKINASKETVNNTGIGFFILMLVTKFCCAPYKPMLCEILEILECCLDLICLLSSGLFLCLPEAVCLILQSRSDDECRGRGRFLPFRGPPVP